MKQPLEFVQNISFFFFLAQKSKIDPKKSKIRKLPPLQLWVGEYTFDAQEAPEEDVTEDTIPDSIPSMAPVAQMAERRTSIPKVVGSNPTWSEIFGFRSWARN